MAVVEAAEASLDTCHSESAREAAAQSCTRHHALGLDELTWRCPLPMFLAVGRFSSGTSDDRTVLKVVHFLLVVGFDGVVMVKNSTGTDIEASKSRAWRENSDGKLAESQLDGGRR